MELYLMTIQLDWPKKKGAKISKDGIKKAKYYKKTERKDYKREDRKQSMMPIKNALFILN